jgi:hypothetical protein
MGLSAIQVATSTTPAIPFRSESIVSTDRLAFAGVALTLVLVTISLALYIAKRRGWLGGALPQGRKHTDRTDSLVIRASRRVSGSTALYVVAYGDREFLVLESARGTSARISGLTQAEINSGDKQ